MGCACVHAFPRPYLSYFVQAAEKEYHRLGGHKSGRKSKINAPADLVSGDGDAVFVVPIS